MSADAHIISSLYTTSSRYLEICVVHMFEDQSRSSRLNEQKVSQEKSSIKEACLNLT